MSRYTAANYERDRIEVGLYKDGRIVLTVRQTEPEFGPEMDACGIYTREEVARIIMWLAEVLSWPIQEPAEHEHVSEFCRNGKKHCSICGVDYGPADAGEGKR